MDMQKLNKIIKEAEIAYKKVSVMIPKIQKEINSFRGIDFSELVKGDIQKIEDFSQAILKYTNIIGGGIDDIFSTSLKVENVTSKLSDGIKKVSEISSVAKKTFSSIKEEAQKLSNLDFEKIFTGDFRSVSESGDILINTFDKLTSAVDLVTNSYFNLSNASSALKDGYQKVKDVMFVVSGTFSDIKKEAENFKDLDFTSNLESGFTSVSKIGDTAMNIMNTLALSVNKVTGNSFILSQSVGEIQNKYDMFKSAIYSVQEAMQEALNPDLVITFDGNLKKAKDTADQFFGSISSNSSKIEKIFKGTDIKGWSNIAQSSLNGVLGVVSTLKDQIGNLSKIDFAAAVSGGAGGIAQATGKTLEGISAIGNSIFSATIGIIKKVNEMQIAEAEKQRDREIKIIEEQEQAKKAAIQKSLEEKKEGYQKEIDDINTREEEKALVTEEWQEYMKEYNAEKKEDMLAEDYERLQEEKESEEAKYNEKMAKYDEDAIYKEEIINQMQVAEDEARAATGIAEQEALVKKEEAEKTFQNKKAAIQKKAAVAQRAMDLFNATIAMFKGMAQAAATGMMAGFPLAIGMVPALVAIAAGIGGAQVAAIAKQPLPEIPSYAEGGFVGSANDHLYNFIPKAKNKNDRTLAWLSEGEYVLPVSEALIYQRMAGENVNNYNSSSSVKNINVYTTVNAMTTASPQKLAKMNAEAVVLAISRGY